MNLNSEKNKQLIRGIFAGTAGRHAFLYQPPLIPMADVGDYTLSNQPVQNWVPWVAENYRRKVESLERHRDDSVPTAKLSTGTQLFANAFGCRVHIPPNDNPCAIPMVNCAADADKLQVPDIWKTECLYRVFQLGDAVRRELGPDVDLGICDMQTGFDTANLIWDKNDLLCAMMLEPDAVKRLSRKCALLLKTFLIELRKEFPTMSPCHCPGNWTPPELGPWVSNDEVGIMSPEMFEEFCLPELNDLSETFGGIGMHCCADAEHQFPGFNKINNFYGFNRVASKRGYLPLLEHFGGPSGPVHCLAWLSEETVEQLVARAPAGTRFIFVQLGPDDEAGARWLARGRALSNTTAV
ncbi:MAG: uroporphyrinogen decarboxylase family protein [Pseudomonadota bacterium]